MVSVVTHFHVHVFAAVISYLENGQVILDDAFALDVSLPWLCLPLGLRAAVVATCRERTSATLLGPHACMTVDGRKLYLRDEQ